MANEKATLCNPAPLGLAGFGLTTIVLSSINAGLLDAAVPSLLSVVVPLAFAYGGVAQIITGIMEFRNGNSFGTVAFTSYGLFWWWYSLLLWTVGAGWIKPPAAPALGLTLLLWGVLTVLLWISTFRLSLCIWIVFLLLWITFFCLAAGEFGIGSLSHTIGGWLGLATGTMAMYAAFAEVTNQTFKRELIPLGPPIL